MSKKSILFFFTYITYFNPIFDNYLTFKYEYNIIVKKNCEINFIFLKVISIVCNFLIFGD